MNRGLSTVLDVGIACLLVTASATLLVTSPDGVNPASLAHAAPPPDADRVGRAVLVSTVTMDSDSASDHSDQSLTVDTSVADILVGAVEHEHGELDRQRRRRVLDKMGLVAAPINISASAVPIGQNTRTVDSINIGQTPPPGAAVDAAVFRFGTSSATIPVVAVTVRTWSP